MQVPVANVLMLALSHVAGPLMTMSSPPGDVTVTIVDDRDRVRGGQVVRYQVVVRNAGPAEAPVLVKLTLPPDTLSAIEADSAAVVANAVAWRNTVAAGQAQTFTLAGRVELDSPAKDLSVTACVHNSAHASVCATDRNVIAGAEKPRERGIAGRWAWMASIIFGILAVIGALWLHRRVNPPLLTPASAASENVPQPGGAPSA